MKRNKWLEDSIKFLPIAIGGINTSALPDDENQILPAFVNKIGDFLLVLAYPAALIGLAYTAYILITSIGKPEAITTAKKNITYIVTGIFIIYFSQYIIQFIRGLLVR